MRRLPRPVARVVDSIKFRVVLAASLLFTMVALLAALWFVQGWISEIERREPVQLRAAITEICDRLVAGLDPTIIDSSATAPISYRITSDGQAAMEGLLGVGGSELAAPPSGACVAPDRWQVTRGADTETGSVGLIATRTVTLPQGVYTIQTSQTLQATPDDISAIVHAVQLGIPLLVGVVAVLLWFVTAQALRPVREISRYSEQISLGSIDTRLPDPVHDDELADLTRHLNRMLGRLDDASTRQQQFVSDASHELRSPVATILAITERSNLRPEDVARVHTEASRLSGLIDSLIELARVQEGGTVIRDLVHIDEVLLEDSERALVQAERRAVTIDTTEVHDLRLVVARAALAGVVRNLVDNAVRHAATEVSLRCALDGEWGIIEVHDDGPGIPEDQREAVFERFVRLDHARSRGKGGTGLGLALVRDLVTAHGGQVRALASPLGGACFQVRLPLDPSDDHAA